MSFGTGFGTGGAGVVVFESQRIFGGDRLCYYLGDYAINGQTVSGSAEVNHYAGPPANIFGPIQRLKLDFQGQYTGGDQMQAVGVDPTQPLRRVTMVFQRLANPP